MSGDGGIRVALVHEWLVHWGGSESVLLSLARLFPQAPIYTLVHHPDPRTAAAFRGRDVRTTPLQGVPGAGRHYRSFLPVMPWAWRSLDLEGFDLIISSSHSLAKCVRVPERALHVCYCHTPPRYLWDLNATYRGGGAALLRGPILRWLQRQDRAGAAGVDAFFANSSFVRDRIHRTYGARATVVYPPVDVEAFPTGDAVRDAYLAGGRLVAYKRIDLAVAAANRGRFRLVVFGDGPERARLERMAGATVTFVGAVDHETLAGLVRGCRAYLFPGVEDFGILPVEVQAAGSPVVAFERGGASETVIDGETGVLFPEQSVESLLDAIERLESHPWNAEACRAQAMRFSRERFEERMSEEIQRLLSDRGRGHN